MVKEGRMQQARPAEHISEMESACKIFLGKTVRDRTSFSYLF